MPTRSLSLLALLACGAALASPSTGDVRRALKSGERGQVVQLLAELEGQLDKSLVKALLAEAPRVKSLGVYDELVTTLRSASGDALEELLKQATRHRRAEVRFLLVDAIGRVADPAVEEALVEALTEDDDETVSVLAARQLGRRGTPSAVDALIPVLEELEEDARKLRLVREVNGALAQLTGQDLSAAEDWRNYWDAHRDGFAGSATPDDGSTHTRDRSVMDRMRRERPAETRTMERLREDDIIVIRGSSDKVELVLEALDLPHRKHERGAFDGLELDPSRQVLVLNCAGREDMSDVGVRKVREFVARGGYVFSSDWELRSTLAKAFPEVVGFLGETPSEDRRVKIRPPAEQVNHPLMRDVFPLNSWVESNYEWTLDGRSHLVRPSPYLTVLVECPEIQELGSTAVAFTFGFSAEGGGRPVTGLGGTRKRRGPQGGQVLHVLSHFKNQKDKSGDGFALQQLLLNFIVEKQEARKAELAGR